MNCLQKNKFTQIGRKKKDGGGSRVLTVSTHIDYRLENTQPLNSTQYCALDGGGEKIIYTMVGII